jgi:hypothetical protein
MTNPPKLWPRKMIFEGEGPCQGQSGCQQNSSNWTSDGHLRGAAFQIQQIEQCIRMIFYAGR